MQIKTIIFSVLLFSCEAVRQVVSGHGAGCGDASLAESSGRGSVELAARAASVRLLPKQNGALIYY